MSTDGGPAPDLSRRLGYLFKHASLHLGELHTAALAPYGIDSRELGILVVIAGHPGASQQEVAQRMGVDRTTMVAMLDTLGAKGLVFRHPSETDRRRNVLDLTDHGRKTLRGAISASDAAEEKLLAPLAPADRDQLRALLQQVVTPHHP